MIQDVDVKAMKKNAFRVSKERGMTASRVRVPGGLVSAKSMARIVEIAEEYGRGEIFLTNRQGVEIPGIHMEDMPKVNELLRSIIEETRINQEDSENGYMASGTRNVTACPGKRLCPFGCYDTTAFAQRMDHEIFPNDRHVKVAFTGCSNDCAHVALNDFGIIGQAKMDYVYDRCIGCGQCVDACKKHATGVLSLTEDKKVAKDTCCCLGCGECAVVCPAGAWVRQPKKFFRITIGGRTGKHTPRLGKTFINFATEEVVLGVLGNWQKFSAWVLDYKPVYMHGGHLIDMAGYEKFKEMILDGVELNPEAKVAQRIMWAESEMRGQINVIPIGEHPVAGPQQ